MQQSNGSTWKQNRRLYYFSLLIILSIPASAGTRGVVIIGDSLSAQYDSWPRYLPGHKKLLVQSGRSIAGYDIPRDLVAGRPFTHAVYFLGTNDRGNVAAYFRTHITTLQQRGFRVLVVVTPAHPYLPDTARGMQLRHCSAFTWNCVDLVAWDPSKTTDTVHPLPELSRAIAAEIADHLVDLDQ